MNETTETLGLASRITKPIPLAALALLVVTIIALALIKIGWVNVGTRGYTIIGIVAGIALITLILAMSIAKTARVTIKTGGDYSPGEVGGDYSVTQGVKPPRHSHPGDTSPRNSALPLNSTSIKTEGSHSPGHVGGDYSVEEDSPS